jgi:hypothetical protein
MPGLVSLIYCKPAIRAEAGSSATACTADSPDCTRGLDRWIGRWWLFSVMDVTLSLLLCSFK